MDDLHSWWEVPSIAHFCSLFRSAFDLTDFDIEDLEEGFLQAQTEDGSAFLVDLLIRLLKGCYGKDVTITNFDVYVKDIIKYKWEITDHPIKEKSEFKTLTMREKVELIYAICEYRLDTEEVITEIKGFEGDSMRVEPLGKDKNGALYWYFYGTRLYVEDPEPKKEVTKEEKRARDRQRRIEAKKKKQEEKRQKKEEKKKFKALRKVERKKKLEEAAKHQKKIEESNTRRSGRLRTRKIEIPESSSSESSSSSEEEETEESSEEEVEEEEKDEQKPGKGRSRKQTAKTPIKKEAASEKTGSSKKETLAKGRRSSRRSGAAGKSQMKTPDKTPQTNTNSRRSSRLRRKPEPSPLPSPYNGETEEENDYDSGHESGGSLRSETSKASTSRKSQPGRLPSRRPTVNVDFKRDPSHAEDEDEVEGKDGDSYTADDGKGDCKVNSDDEGKAVEKDSAKDEGGKGDNKVSSGDEGKGDKSGSCDNSETLKREFDIEDGSGEGKEVTTMDTPMNEEAVGSMGTSVVDIKKEPVDYEDDKHEESQDNQKLVNENSKSEESDNVNETCETQDAEKNLDEVSKNQDSERLLDEGVTKETKESTFEEGMSIKIENVAGEEIENKEMKVDHDERVNEESSKDKEDGYSENNDVENEKQHTEIKFEDEELSNDTSDANFKRVLRKRNTEEVKSEPKNSEHADDKEIVTKEQTEARVFTMSKPAVAPQPSNSSTRWHLVCETLDDWINLAEWFKESEIRCERALSKVIREDFLPVLPEIIDAREKERLKRLLQEQELRRSNRITIKMREKMEQEKILAEALADEEKARIKSEEEKKLKDEQLRLEEENRQREERRKAREERAKRLSMRGERARFLAEGKEIPPEMIYTGSNKYKDDGEDSDDSKCDLREEEDFEALLKVINAMKYHKDCWPFLEPVTDEQAPGYSDVIKRPMDLSKIEDKVEKREYRSTQHFLSDFRLMFNNCKRFNGQDSEFSDCARSMENMLKKYMKRFVSDEPTDKYYEDKPFVLPGGRGVRTAEKRYRPQRAASSRALQTVHKALNSDEEETDSDDEDRVPVRKKPKEGASESVFKTQSHHNLLLQEMIELKRQREKKLAASALHNHGVITRGPERIRVPNPQGGIMIIPKSEMNATGVLRMAATREIKRKVAPQPQLPNLAPPNRQGKPQVVHNSGSETVLKADLSKKEPGLSILDQTTPGSNQPKTIRIVASNGNGQPSVKQTAESVKVSADGYLIISGKNSGIKVTENTKIVIQPPGAIPSAEGSSQPQAMSKEILIKKIPTPLSLKQIPGLTVSDMSKTQDNVAPGSPSATVPSANQVSSQVTATASPCYQMPIQQQVSLQRLLKQTASNPQLTQQQQALQGFVNQMGEKGQLTPDMKKKLDIAQRILLLNQQKRKLLEQQKMPQQQQQLNGPPPGVQPPKIIKLDLGAGAVNSSAIENRLRDPSVNIDNQLGSVSQNVISNVNIASDILDTYYSVLNDAKSKANMSTHQNNPSVSLTISQNTEPLTQNVVTSQSVANTTISQLPTTVQGVLVNQASRTDATVSESPKPAPVQGNMSEVTRQIYNLISKSGSGGLVSALAKAQLMKQGTPTTIQQVSNEESVRPIVQISAIPSQSVSVSNLVSQDGLYTQESKPVTTLTSNSSISDLLRSAMVKPETKSTEVSPIEALFSNNTQVKTELDSASKTDAQSIFIQAMTSKPPVTLNASPQNVLQQKNERQNLFDTFETGKSNVVPSEVAGEPCVTSQSESSNMSKEIKSKLRADGVSLPSSSVLNFGSPLKTSSVLEALKCKLTTVKPQGQSSENPSSTVNVQSVCICSELASCSSPASSDLLCELHPCYMCTCPSNERLLSSNKPACNSSEPSINSSVERLNCVVDLAYTDVFSPECSLDSPNTDVFSPECSQASPNTDVFSPECSQASPNTDVYSPECSLDSPNTNVYSPECSQASLNTDVFSPECSQASLNTNVFSPECSLDSPSSVQSENILQNLSVEESNISEIPNDYLVADENYLKEDEILTAVPLEEYLQTAQNGGTEFFETEDILDSSTNKINSILMKDSEKEVMKQNERRSVGYIKGSKNVNRIQEIRLNTAIETDDQNNLEGFSIEKTKDTYNDYRDGFVEEEHLCEHNVKVGIKEKFLNRIGGFCESDTENADFNMLAKDSVHKDMARSEFVYTDGELNSSDSNRNKTFSCKNFDDSEKICVDETALEFIVKQVCIAPNCLDINGDQSLVNTEQKKEYFTLIPSIPSLVCTTSESGQDYVRPDENGNHDNMPEERKSFKRPMAKKSDCKGKYENKHSEDVKQEVRIVFRPLRITRDPTEMYNPIQKRNDHTGHFQSFLNSTSKNSVRKDLPSVQLEEDSVCEIGRKKFSEAISVETNKKNRKVNRKVNRKLLRFSNEPLKMYKLSGLKPNFSTSNIEDKTPGGKTFCSDETHVDNMNRQCKEIHKNGAIHKAVSEPVKVCEKSVMKPNTSSENICQALPAVNMTALNKTFSSNRTYGTDNSQCKKLDLNENGIFLANNEKQDIHSAACQELKSNSIKATSLESSNTSLFESVIGVTAVNKNMPTVLPIGPSCPTSVKKSARVESVETCLSLTKLSSEPLKINKILGRKAKSVLNQNQSLPAKGKATFNETFLFEWKHVDNQVHNDEKHSNEDDTEAEKQDNQLTGCLVLKNSLEEEDIHEPSQNRSSESDTEIESHKRKDSCSAAINGSSHKTPFENESEVESVKTSVRREYVQRNIPQLSHKQENQYKISKVMQDSPGENWTRGLKTKELAEGGRTFSDKEMNTCKKVVSRKRKVFDDADSAMDKMNKIKKQYILSSACQGSSGNTLEPHEIPMHESCAGIMSANGKDLHSILLSSSFKTKINKLKVVESFEKGLDNEKVKVIKVSSEPLRMYKIAGVKSRSFVENFCHGLQTVDITPVGETCCSDGKHAEKASSECKNIMRKNMKIKNRKNFIKNDISVSNTKKQDILLAACQALKNISSEEDLLEAPESPFFESDIGIESEIPLSDFDINQIFNEDFFSTELYSPIHPSNLFYGDGSNIETELEKIETDVFELQDRYPTSVGAVGSLQPGDQIILPTASANLQQSTVNNSMNTNTLEVHQGVVNISSNSSIQTPIPAVVPHVVSVSHMNVLSAIPAVQTSMNVFQNTVPLTVAQELSKGSIIVQQPAAVQVPTNLIQGNALQGLLPTVLPKERVNVVPQVTAMQSSVPQAQMQVPTALLEALQQVAGNATVNQSSQNALLQQLNVLVNNGQSNPQLGAQNINIVKNVQQISQLNSTTQINQQAYTQSHSDIKSEPSVLQVHNVPQLSDVTFTNIASTQNDNLEQVGMEFGSETQSMDVSSTYPACGVGITGTSVNSDTLTFSNHISEAGGTDLNTAVSRNLSTVSQMGAISSGSDTQLSFSVTQTDGDVMDTSHTASTSLIESTENQSV